MAIHLHIVSKISTWDIGAFDATFIEPLLGNMGLENMLAWQHNQMSIIRIFYDRGENYSRLITWANGLKLPAMRPGAELTLVVWPNPVWGVP